MPGDSVIESILAMKTIAVVGLSPNTARASNAVSLYLLAHGYRIIPVNPGQDEILGLKSYPALRDIPEPIDLVNVFRRPEYTPQVAQGAVDIGAKALWLQLGIVNDEAVAIAEAAGLLAVQDRCMRIEHRLRS